MVSIAQEPRIAEQQFGNLQSMEKIMRCKQERDDVRNQDPMSPHSNALWVQPGTFAPVFQIRFDDSVFSLVQPGTFFSDLFRSFCLLSCFLLQCLSAHHSPEAAFTQFGRFFYRFPQGEAGLDVYNRVTGFIETVRRRHTGSECCIVIVTHGLALRLFLMRWFQVQWPHPHSSPSVSLMVFVYLYIKFIIIIHHLPASLKAKVSKVSASPWWWHLLSDS